MKVCSVFVSEVINQYQLGWAVAEKLHYYSMYNLEESRNVNSIKRIRRYNIVAVMSTGKMYSDVKSTV